MTKKCSRDYGKTLDEGSVEHGVTDRLGREVGYRWRIREVFYRERTPEQDGSYGYFNRPDDQPEMVFEMWGSPTRDGSKYGPAFNYTEFLTLEEARRAAVKRVEQAAKRDTKKFTKVPA